MKKEIERKFLVDYSIIPWDTIDYKEKIEQFYININPENRLRKLEKSNIFKHTIKSSGNLVRDEIEFNVDSDFFNRSKIIKIGDVIVKERNFIYLDKYLKVELDVHVLLRLKGLVVAEVEFETEEAANAFNPLPWFGKEVTDLRMFKTVILATNTDLTYESLMSSIE